MTHILSYYAGWTEMRSAECVRLWREGLSASQIAKQLGGITRNAVIGKVHRLGLAQRQMPAPLRASGAAKKRAAPTQRVTRSRKTQPLPKEPPVLDVSNARPWEERELGQCAWPITINSLAHSCCAPVGHSNRKWAYCPAHMARMFAPARERSTASRDKHYVYVADRAA